MGQAGAAPICRRGVRAQCRDRITQAQAADPPIVISTGKSGGGYNTIGERLKTVLAEQDQLAQVLTSAG